MNLPILLNNKESPASIGVTHPFIHNLVYELWGGDAPVVSLLHPGEDPQKRPVNLLTDPRLKHAKLIISTGTLLDGPSSPALPPASTESTHYLRLNAPTPHSWLLESVWLDWVATISHVLQKEFPEKAPQIRQRTQTYRDQCHRQFNRIREAIASHATSPIATNHPAFQTFAEQFGILAYAIEPNQSNITVTFEMLQRHNVHRIVPIFQIPQQDIQAIASHALIAGYVIEVTPPVLVLNFDQTPSGIRTYVDMIAHAGKQITH
jgi:ABC-type Zn uptake system ZnuABC Zn-binding protein ZnuA